MFPGIKPLTFSPQNLKKNGPSFNRSAHLEFIHNFGGELGGVDVLVVEVIKLSFFAAIDISLTRPGNTKGGSITVSLTGLESAV